MVRQEERVVAIAGNLMAAAVPDLHAELVRSRATTLDCTELRRVDQEGAAFLKRWQRGGGNLVGVSQLLALMLEADSAVESSEPDDRSVTR